MLAVRGQKLIGWALVALGALGVLAGSAVMIVLGPDGRLTTGPHPIATDGVAVATAPGVIDWKGLQVDVLVEVPVNKPVFVGVGNSVDVENYLSTTQRLEVTEFETPWKVSTTEVEGEPNLASAPTALDWWIANQAGLGAADISLELPDEAVSLVIVSVGSSNLSGLEVSLAYGIKGGFGRGAGLALIGAGLVWLGLLVGRGSALTTLVLPEPRTRAYEIVEEEVYVWVDEDGVEHEIDPDDLEDFEIVEDVGSADDEEPPPEPEVSESEASDEMDDDTDPEMTELRSSVARLLASRPGAPLTAGELARAAERGDPGPEPVVVPEPEPEPTPEPEPEPEPTPEPQPEPEPEPAPTQRVMFVFVDEDGVEHEVSEDELDQYEIVDDEEDER